jgi:hypothetical protein
MDIIYNEVFGESLEENNHENEKEIEKENPHIRRKKIQILSEKYNIRKPLNPFFIYCEKKRKEIMKFEGRKVNIKELTKKWNSMTKKQKKKVF